MHKLLLSAFLLGLVILAATPAMAAEAEGESAGLMSLDTATIIITIVVFIILLVVLSKTAWRPILDALKQREETISKALDDAKAANDAARAKIAEYEAKIDEAKEEAQAIADEARKDAEDIRARIQQEAQEEASKSVARASREIDQLAAKAWEKVVADAADVATEAASRIISKDLSSEAHAELVAGVVSDFAARKGDA